MVKIPLEIIIEKVLLRVPVKSLVRFKCVNKHWFSTISHDPYFHRLHLNKVRGDQKTKIIVLIPNNSSIYSMDYESLCCEENYGRKLAAVERIKPPAKSKSICIMCGSCDGLLLLSSYYSRYFILWNPSIKSYREITIPRDLIYPCLQLYGLCYDSSIHDYKVLTVTMLDRDNDRDRDQVKRYSYTLFSTKSSTWTEIRKFPYECYYGSQRVVIVNGALHWIVQRDNPAKDDVSIYYDEPSKDYVIIYYDVVEDEFKELLGPSTLNDLRGYELENLRGRLCIYESNWFRRGSTYKSGLKVWEMKEYGVEESWIPLFEMIPDVQFPTIFPLCFNEKGEVVMECYFNSALSVYDTKEKRIKMLKAFDRYKGVFAYTYIESLVSPGGEINGT